MPLTSWIWGAGLFDEPQTEISRQLEELRQRRVELARQARERLLDEQRTTQELEQAERAAREAKAAHAAMGGPADEMKAAVKRFEAAIRAHERAVERPTFISRSAARPGEYARRTSDYE